MSNIKLIMNETALTSQEELRSVSNNHLLATMNHGPHYYWVTLTDMMKFEGIIIIYMLTIMCTIFEMQEGIIIGKTKA